MLSYWEREYFLNQPQVTIVGAGIVGLTTALFIKDKHPDYEVVVCEKGFLPDGASTKNAGFCCFGSVSELGSDLKLLPREEVINLAVRRYTGLQLLKRLVGENNMDYEAFGGYEVFTEKETFQSNMSLGNELNSLLEKTVGRGVYSDASGEASGLGLKGISGMILNRYEGQVDTGKMMQTLLEKARISGIKVFFGLEVKSFSDNKHNVDILTQFGWSFKTDRLFITTNGFARQLLPGLEVKPARAQVLITQPVRGLKLRGSFHYDEGYYYFRNVGDRVLLGGGRNLDFHSEETYEKGLTELVQQQLERLLSASILSYTDFSVDMRWSGTMGVGPVKQTIVKQLSENVCCGVRMGGMGVALGSLVGQELSEML